MKMADTEKAYLHTGLLVMALLSLFAPAVFAQSTPSTVEKSYTVNSYNNTVVIRVDATTPEAPVKVSLSRRDSHSGKSDVTFTTNSFGEFELLPSDQFRETVSARQVDPGIYNFLIDGNWVNPGLRLQWDGKAVKLIQPPVSQSGPVNGDAPNANKPDLWDEAIENYQNEKAAGSQAATKQAPSTRNKPDTNGNPTVKAAKQEGPKPRLEFSSFGNTLVVRKGTKLHTDKEVRLIRRSDQKVLYFLTNGFGEIEFTEQFQEGDYRLGDEKYDGELNWDGKNIVVDQNPWTLEQGQRAEEMRKRIINPDDRGIRLDEPLEEGLDEAQSTRPPQDADNEPVSQTLSTPQTEFIFGLAATHTRFDGTQGHVQDTIPQINATPGYSNATGNADTRSNGVGVRVGIARQIGEFRYVIAGFAENAGTRNGRISGDAPNGNQFVLDVESKTSISGFELGVEHRVSTTGPWTVGLGLGWQNVRVKDRSELTEFDPAGNSFTGGVVDETESDDSWFGSLHVGFDLDFGTRKQYRVSLGGGYRYAFDKVLNSSDNMDALQAEILFSIEL